VVGRENAIGVQSVRSGRLACAAFLTLETFDGGIVPGPGPLHGGVDAVGNFTTGCCLECAVRVLEETIEEKMTLAELSLAREFIQRFGGIRSFSDNSQ